MTDEMICLPAEYVENSILLIRGKKVVLDRVLARLYGVSTRVLNQTVKRNQDRFPPDFMFQLTSEETRKLNLRSQTWNKSRENHRKDRPYAFTAQGILMLSSVLRSEHAIQTNIETMRAFIRLREMMKAPVVKRRQIGFLG